MRLGCTLGSLGGVGSRPAGYVEFARQAERLGYESVWSAEGFGTDPVSLLAWIAGQTTEIGLGTAVMQLSSRSPVTAAMTAATLAQISGGRFRLGLGPSGPKVVEGWHGQHYSRPLARTRDYVAVLRMALAGQPIRYAGETITLPVAGSEVAPMPMHVPAQLASVPVYLAGLGPKAIELAGEIADGWLPVHCPPEFVAVSRSRLAAGAERAGRSLAGFDVAVMAFAVVEEDLDLARDTMRPLLALYLGGMGTPAANFYYRLACRLGFGPAAAAVRESYLLGYLDEAAAAVPDELVDTMTMAGPPERVRERLAAYRDAGTSTLIVALVSQSLPERREQLEWIAELAPDA
ncbi:MAG TPA: LLM class flavin-dependent oxidoreductase [Streptosporangiaceae bacterium]|jgi:F420-dependent oxidoreductase-like protein